MHLIAALTTILLLQTPVTPEVKLNVPKKPVAFSRFVKMSVDPIPQTTTAPNDFVKYIVDWDVTERSVNENPLENDLDIDSNGMKAIIPSGDKDTSVKVSVTVIFIYKDNSTRVAKQVEYVQIGSGIPTPGPVPNPLPPLPPTPVPVPPAPIPPAPVVEQFGATTFTKTTLAKTTLDKAQATALGLGFHQVAQLARNQAGNMTKEQVVQNMVDKNTATLGNSMPQWVDGFLKPLQLFINPMSPKIKTVNDQAQLFDEIGYGLEQYGAGK